jgi:transposase
MRQADVVGHFGVSRQTVSRWYRSWEAGGQAALKGTGRTGRNRELSQAQLSELEELLLGGPENAGYSTNLWTLKSIAQVIWNLFRVRYHPGHAWKLLAELGWSCQRPESRARERNERAIRRWLRHRWPAIKKRREIVARS